MKMRIAAGVVAIVLGICMLTVAAGEANSGQEVMGLVKELSQAYIKADTAKLSQIMSDDWELVTLEGETWSKENMLKLIGGKQLVILSEDYTDMKVRVYGDMAVVTARVAGTGANFSNEQRASYVFIRKQGNWQCVHTQGTPLHQENWTFVARDPNAKKPRVGVYDSRAVVMAFFFSQAYNDTDAKKGAEFDAELKKAKASGDNKQIAAVEAKYSDVTKLLKQRHLQVFSTAPADDVLENVKDKMPEITKAAKIEAIVSKWDKQALAKYKDAELVDVTIPLIYAFHPTMERLISAMDLMSKQPIPLDKAEKIDWSKE